jgi:hypothetical protein
MLKWIQGKEVVAIYIHMAQTGPVDELWGYHFNIGLR